MLRAHSSRKGSIKQTKHTYELIKIMFLLQPFREHIFNYLS